MATPESGSEIFNGPPRPDSRIDELLSLLAEDWKASGSDQRFFQYIFNLKQRLGLPADSYNIEDAALVGQLKSNPGTSGRASS